MELAVELFAAAREQVGDSPVSVTLAPPHDVAALRATLAQLYPPLAALLARSSIAVNDAFAGNSQVLQPTDRVAVIPPVSGG